MKHFLMAASLCAASAVFATPASAAPPSAPATAVAILDNAASNSIEQVAYRDHRRMLRKKHRLHRHRHHHHHYGQRYRDRHIDWSDRRYRAYRGWDHYYYRPYDWRSRGCIVIGPIWFCP